MTAAYKVTRKSWNVKASARRVLLIVTLSLSGSYTFSQPKPGQPAADISLTDVNGNTRKLSELSGKVVLVDFWASWCAPCRKTNPVLVKLYNKYKQKGFEIYSVSIDEEKLSWKKAIAADKMTWTHVIEPGGWDGPTALAWQINQVPTSFLLDKKGKIVSKDPSTLSLERKIVQQLKN